MNFHGFPDPRNVECQIFKILSLSLATSHMQKNDYMCVCNRCLVDKLVQTYSVVQGSSANNLKVPASNILNGGWQRQAADPAQMSLDTDFVFFLPFIRSFACKFGMCPMTIYYSVVTMNP